MMNNKYIIFLYYEYNHKTDIINIDNKLDKLINLTVYDKIYKFFSQPESRRYYVISIYNLHIYKLIKILRFPFTIDSILKVLKVNVIQKDKYGFTKVNFDIGDNNIIQPITTKNNDNEYNEYQINKYKNYILEPENILLELYKMTNNQDKIVRIYGPDYNNLVPINFQLTEDLTIYVYLKTS